MATRTYYGICTTGSTVVQKDVYISDTDIQDGFNFQKGDLLVVFFADTNTVSAPSIVVYNQDTNNEVSIIDDSGKLIKTLDVESNLENAWAAGETVIFAYTQQSNTTTYYWELVDANHASIETYGDTKLFDDNQLKNLLAGTYDGDEDIALTPNALKQFYDLLKSTEDDESPLKLTWAQDKSVTGESQNLGMLSLTNNTGGVIITYPIESKITQVVMDDLELKNITHTGQLVNNGNGLPGDKTSTSAEPFITRNIPNNLYFTNGSGLYYGGAAKVILNNSANKLFLDGTQGIVLDAPTNINGALQASSLVSNGTITAGGNIAANNSGQIYTNGAIKGGTLYEGGVPLNQKYGSLYKVVAKNTKTGAVTVTLDGNKTTDHLYFNVNTESGYTPIGIVGYNISELKSGAGHPRLKNLWECCMNGTNVQYAVQNLGSNKDTFYVTFWVLYKKN